MELPSRSRKFAGATSVKMVATILYRRSYNDADCMPSFGE